MNIGKGGGDNPDHKVTHEQNRWVTVLYNRHTRMGVILSLHPTKNVSCFCKQYQPFPAWTGPEGSIERRTFASYWTEHRGRSLAGHRLNPQRVQGRAETYNTGDECSSKSKKNCNESATDGDRLSPAAWGGRMLDRCMDERLGEQQLLTVLTAGPSRSPRHS